MLETTAIADIADVPSALRVADVGNGGVISVMDRSTIYNKKLVSYVLELAELKGIKAQVKRFVSGGNDAAHIHKSGNGVKNHRSAKRAGFTSIPQRVPFLAVHFTARTRTIFSEHEVVVWQRITTVRTGSRSRLST